MRKAGKLIRQRCIFDQVMLNCGLYLEVGSAHLRCGKRLDSNQNHVGIRKVRERDFIDVPQPHVTHKFCIRGVSKREVRVVILVTLIPNLVNLHIPPAGAEAVNRGCVKEER